MIDKAYPLIYSGSECCLSCLGCSVCSFYLRKRDVLMNKKKMSVVFGAWVKRMRMNKGFTQAQCSEKTGIPQAKWSRIERSGVLLPDDVLKSLCDALDCSISEALVHIQATTASSQRISFNQSSYSSFTQRIVERDRSSVQVGVFVLRESPEPVDYVALEEYAQFFRETKSSIITLLFRYPDPRVWRSALQLRVMLAEKLDVEIDAVSSRIRAFYRRPEYTEPPETALPLLHPYVLTSDRTGVDIASFVFDDDLRRTEIAEGWDEPQAIQRSLSVVGHDRYMASKITQWIGLASTVDPLSELWVPVIAP